MSFEEESFTFKVILVGNASVGKTCIIKRISNNEFDDREKSTIGSQFTLIKEQVDDTKISLQVFDTAGQERFRGLVKMFFRNAAAALIVYSIDDQNSFDSIDEWINTVRSEVEDTIFILVANKSDLYQDKNYSQKDLISIEKGESKAENLGIPFFDVSAKNGLNINDLFQKVANCCLRKEIPPLPPPPSPSTSSKFISFIKSC